MTISRAEPQHAPKSFDYGNPKKFKAHKDVTPEASKRGPLLKGRSAGDAYRYKEVLDNTSHEWFNYFKNTLKNAS